MGRPQRPTGCHLPSPHVEVPWEVLAPPGPHRWPEPYRSKSEGIGLRHSKRKPPQTWHKSKQAGKKMREERKVGRWDGRASSDGRRRQDRRTGKIAQMKREKLCPEYIYIYIYIIQSTTIFEFCPGHKPLLSPLSPLSPCYSCPSQHTPYLHPHPTHPKTNQRLRLNPGAEITLNGVCAERIQIKWADVFKGGRARRDPH